MKRRLRMLIVFLLLGAIVNVAIAWGCIGLPQSLTYRIYSEDRVEEIATPLEAAWWREAFPNLPPSEGEFRTTESRRIGWAWADVRYLANDSEGGSLAVVGPQSASPGSYVSRSVTHVACGFPAHSLMGVETSTTGTQASRSGALAVPSFLKRWLGQWDWIPTHPIWLGFAINTIFYATILWLLFVVPSKARRRWRIHRGRCPMCAYPVGTSLTCTECGKPLRSRPSENKLT